MAESSSLLISLRQMVDLALGSPELGAVNFNLLSAVLHVIIEHLKLSDLSVEMRDPDKDRVKALILTSKPGVSLKVTECLLKNDQTPKRGSTQAEVEIGQIRPRANSKSAPQSPKAFTQGVSLVRTSSQRSRKSDASKTMLVVVEPATPEKPTFENMPRLTLSISDKRFQEFESDVRELKDKMEEILELPKNITLTEAVITPETEKITPLNGLWHTLNLSKRMIAMETGVEKLTSMIEDVVKDIGNLTEAGTTKQQQPQERTRNGSVFLDIADRINSFDERITNLENKRKPSIEMMESGEYDFEQLILDMDALKENVKSIDQDLTNISKHFKGKDIGEMLKDIDELKTKSKPKEGEEVSEGEGAKISAAQLEEFNKMFEEYGSKINNLDDVFSGQMSELQNQLLQIEKELGEVLERVNTTLASTDAEADGMTTSDLYERLVKLQVDYDELSKTTQQILADQDDKQLKMDAWIEQIELMKTVKADREDLEDALADKANTEHVNRKVSHDQFDAACDDLTRSIEETMAKLTQQELMWETTLEEIQTTIGSKIDKNEFDPLREFVNRKIKSLQQRLKALLAMKQEQEAAGTKSRILKNVNCISCDKDVVMQKFNQFATLPSPPIMPGTRSLKPYITYDLDAVRKQQRTLPKARNFNFLENAIQAEKMKEKMLLKTPAAHLCTRYCGGSHTVTSPDQRVTHIGHFLNQWGPTAVPLEEGQVMGTDGQVYKAREAAATATPRSESKITCPIQTDEPKETVPRMSLSIEPTGRSKIVLSGRRASKVITAPVVEEEEEKKVITEKTSEEITVVEEVKEPKQTSRVSLNGSKKPSATKRLISKTEQGEVVSKASSKQLSFSKKDLRQTSSKRLKKSSAAEVQRQTSEVSQKEETVPEAIESIEPKTEPIEESGPVEAELEQTEQPIEEAPVLEEEEEVGGE